MQDGSVLFKKVPFPKRKCWQKQEPAQFYFSCNMKATLSLLALVVACIWPAKPASSLQASKDRPSVGEYINETGFYQSIALSSDEPIFRSQSQYQLIEVKKSPFYGNILVLDGVLQLTERDAASYNEMMAHIAMFQHPNPKRVLVIGGGDGYVLSEVLKHSSVEHVDHVDLDGEVIEVCKNYFKWGAAWRDPRVTLHIADGAAFVKDAKDQSYDVVIQDSSDPWTWGEDGERIDLPSLVLYSDEHFQNIHRILSPNGILNLQAESLAIPSDVGGIVAWRKQVLRLGFQNARYGSLMISSYPTGQIGFLLCEKQSSVLNIATVENRYKLMRDRGLPTVYYQPKLQTSSFDLPLWAEEEIYGSSYSEKS